MINGAVTALLDTFDAVADLFMAEGVFQVRNPHGQIPPDAPAVATVFYEVDRPGRRIIVTVFRMPIDLR